ncbi:squalene epoxidase-domain-containing protein [Sporodiniella umbellata]|nr:squalene epoxidase-domain-containing protein [Sporodiniella umbellata]
MMMMESQEYDLIIVGAGVVGCAAAKAFAEDGRKVLLLERDLQEPDRIVGELMQPGGMQALEALGMKDCTENIDGVACRGYSIYRQEEMVEISYSTNPESDKQFQGIGFHHGRFIQKLRKSAQSTQGVTVKEMTVASLLEADDQVIGVVARDKDQQKEIYAPLTLVADGIFSKFRKEFKEDPTVKVTSHFVGFLLHNVQLPAPEKGFVVLSKPSPVLMYQIGSNDVRVLVDIPGERLPSTDDLKDYMLQQLMPQLPEYMFNAFQHAVNTERLRAMPSGFLPSTANQRAGAILLGDALNVRSPLTGGGMTVALQDVLLCRELLSQQNVPSFTETDLVIQAMGALHWKRKSYSMCINVLAMSLYTIFAAQSETMLVLQRGCFDYFKWVDQGPADLLSGVARSPLLLLYHFFKVAFWSIGLMIQEGGLNALPYNLVHSFVVLYTASVIILPYLWGEFKG